MTMRGGGTGLVFDVQRFSIHDGPGIRTTVFLKGCPLRCRWCQNPESLRPRAELAFHAARCRQLDGCRTCCPRDALGPPGARGDDRIDHDRCDACGLCASACSYRALEVIGRRVTVDELLDEVARDSAFYEASGGGVTVSGGEPTLQIDFVGAFASACRARGIPVGLQTCGAFRWQAVEPHLSSFAFIQLDLKIMDPLEHRRLTGVDNRPILENARRMRAVGLPVQLRMPIVPDHTDGEDNLRQVAAFLRELRIPGIHLLRYHKLGEDKLARLGFPLQPLGLDAGAQARASLARAVAILTAEGLEVTS